jgi:hypothetical protein
VHPACSLIPEVITDMSIVMSVMMNIHIEVCQDEETGEPDIPPPKRIGHPGIQICIIRRRGIIGNHRGPLLGIIGAHAAGIGILSAGRIAGFLTGGIRLHIQAVLVYDILKPL